MLYPSLVFYEINRCLVGGFEFYVDKISVQRVPEIENFLVGCSYLNKFNFSVFLMHVTLLACYHFAFLAIVLRVNLFSLLPRHMTRSKQLILSKIVVFKQFR